MNLNKESKSVDPANPSSDWVDDVLTPDFLQMLNRLASRAFIEPVDSEEAVSYVIEKLTENDFSLTRSFTGKVKRSTYLHMLSSNLLVDFSRRKYGRVRPPMWLKESGGIWVEVWKELALERRFEEDIISRKSSYEGQDRDSIIEIIRVIKARMPWVGARLGRVESLSDSDLLVDVVGEAPSNSLLEVAEEEAKDALLLGLSHLLFGDVELPNDSTPLGSELRRRLSQIDLTADESLMLKMFYVDGLSHSAIARSLGLQKHTPVRVIRKVLNQLSVVFTKEISFYS